MFSEPTKIIEQCGIQAGQEIADLGSGSGFYSLAAGRALMATGKVYAIDVQKDLLSKLKNQATKEGIYNLEVVWGDIEKPNGTKLRDSSVDLTMLCNVLFQIENKPGIIKEIKRILKPGGRTLLVDWGDSFGGIGPHAGSVVKKDVARDMFEKAGFHVDREIQAGSQHYGFIFKKL